MVCDELHGRHIPNGAVRPLLIICSTPGFNHYLGLLQGQKPVLVQALIPKLAVEAINTCILDRLSRWDAMQRDPMLIGPRVQGVPCELRSVVQHQDLRHGPSGKNSIEHSADLLPANRAIPLYHGHLFRVRIGHRQAREPPGDGCGFLPRPAAQRKPALSIDPLNLLVIHPPAFPSQPHVDPGAAVASLGLSDPSYPRPEPLIA